MRVLYDGVVFQNPYQRGIQRGFCELIGHMPEGVEMVLALSERPKRPLPEGARVVRTVPRPVGLLRKELRRAIAPRLAAPALRRLAESCDVFHSTYYTLPPVEMPTVLHVYDLIPEQFPELFGKTRAAREIERRQRAIAQATRIVAISQATAGDLERLYPEAAGKTSTLYFGCDHLVREGGTGAAAAPAEGKDVLYVGDRAGYKNFGLLLAAMQLAEWPHGVGLTVAGRPWRRDEAKAVEQVARARAIRHVGWPGDAELARLYAGARCIVVPSLAEGFGFLVLEGQAAGIPVVCSDIAVFREVAGEGALFFDPRRPEDLASCVREAAAGPVRARLWAAARENLGRFSWDRCAREVLSVYEAALDRSPGQVYSVKV